MRPTGANVNAGTNNTVNVINSYNKNSVSVDVTFGSIPEAGTVTVELSDGTNTASGIAESNIQGTVTTVKGIKAGSLADGTITVKAKITDLAGNENPGGFISGTSATKS